MNVLELFELFCLLLARSLGLIALLPFGWGVLSLGQRLSLALLAAMMIFDPALQTTQITMMWLPAEFLIGLILGLPMVLLIAMANFWGELFDSGRGQNIGMLYDPSSEGQASHTALLMSTLLWLLLLLSGVMGGSFIALKESLVIIPPAGLDTAELTQIGQGIMKLVAFELAGACTAFLPFAVLFLLADLGLGMLARLVPGFGCTAEGFQLKTCLGMFGMLALYQFDLVPGLLTAAAPNLHAILGR